MQDIQDLMQNLAKKYLQDRHISCKTALLGYILSLNCAAVCMCTFIKTIKNHENHKNLKPLCYSITKLYNCLLGYLKTTKIPKNLKINMVFYHQIMHHFPWVATLKLAKAIKTQKPLLYSITKLCIFFHV